MRITLSALELKISTWRHTFHDDGYVDDVVDHTVDLYHHYQFPVPLIMNGGVSGSCFVYGRWKKNIHIYYVPFEDRVEDLLNRAHEEVHALMEMEKLSVLEKNLFKQQKVSLDLRQYDEEIVAEVGGIYALTRNGINPEELKGMEINFKRALVLYEQGKI